MADAAELLQCEADGTEMDTMVMEYHRLAPAWDAVAVDARLEAVHLTCDALTPSVQFDGPSSVAGSPGVNAADHEMVQTHIKKRMVC